MHRRVTEEKPALAERDRTLRIHGRIARDVGTAILSGRIEPGHVLDSEITASIDLQVSRTAYREAIRILAAKGLVTSRPKTGTRVSGPAQWHLLDPDVLAWIFAVEPAPALLESLFELRKTVEPPAAAFAATRRTDRHLRDLAAALADMERHTLGTQAGRDADHRFHATLLDATANPFLNSLASGVAAAVSWTTIFKQRNRPLIRDAVPDHALVLDAIAASDPLAASLAMTRLIDLAYLEIQRVLDDVAHSRRAR